MRQVVAACNALELDDPSPSEEDIRKAYRRLSLAHHPDKNTDAPEEAAQRFQVLTRARDILTDRAGLQRHEATERDAYDPSAGVKGVAGDEQQGMMSAPVAGQASKGWGPCPACGGLKRHVGARACPIYGKWFDTERRVKQAKQGDSQAATSDATASVSGAAAGIPRRASVI